MFDLDGTLILSRPQARRLPGDPGRGRSADRAGTRAACRSRADQRQRLSGRQSRRRSCARSGCRSPTSSCSRPTRSPGSDGRGRGYRSVLVLGTRGVADALHGHGIAARCPATTTRASRRGLRRLAPRVLDGGHPRRLRPRARRRGVLYRLRRAVLRHQGRARVRLFVRDQRRDPARHRREPQVTGKPSELAMDLSPKSWACRRRDRRGRRRCRRWKCRWR